MPAETSLLSALWLTVAILAGGFARTRGRSAWIWFLLTLFTGPIAAFLLVVWPPPEGRLSPASSASSGAVPPAEHPDR